MERRHRLSSLRLSSALPCCRWWPGMPSWKTVANSRQVWKVSWPSGTDHHMVPGRMRSSLGGV